MDVLRRLVAANDPRVHSVSVGTKNLAEYAEALKGNTHIRDLRAHISLPSGDREASERAMTSWKGFCEVAQELSSLQELNIFIAGRHARQHFIIVGTILQHLRQVESIYLQMRFPITDPAYGDIIARNIANHPTLEEFSLENFECSRDDSSFPAVLEALMTVPNLKVVELDSYYDGGDCQLSGKCNDYLGGLMRKGSLGSITFSDFAFTDSQVETMTSAVESPESNLQKMSFWRCRYSADSAQLLIRGIAQSTSLENLCFQGTKLSGFDFNVHADLLLPLSASQSLKTMYLKLDVGAGQTWPRLFSLGTNSVVESLEVDFDYHEPISDDSLASLFERLGANERSNLMELSLRHLEDANVIRPDMLAPLATNKSLKKLEIEMFGSSNADDDVVVEWPRFDFLQENQALEHLTFWGYACVPGNGFESLCQGLRTTSTLKVLDLLYCGLNDGHCVSLAQMISDNVGLEKIVLSGTRFKREGLLTLVPSLIRNTSLRTLEVQPEDPEQVNGTDEFARSVLSQTHLRELVVGPWDADDPKPLLKTAAQNYHIERLEFQRSANPGAYRILKGTINAITKLNKAGRGYLGNRNKGPECKAAAVIVLSNVSDDLNCIFYHLRENPLLCNRRSGGGGLFPAGFLGTATSQQEEGRDIMPMPLRRSKKRRTSTEEP